MATSHPTPPKTRRTRPHPSSRDGSGGSNANDEEGTGLTGLINAGLTSSFDAIRERISSGIGSNGEEYLHEAVDKITEATAQVASWCKKNPIKMVVGIAALTAVSAFLVHTMGANGAAVRRGARKSVKAAKASHRRLGRRGIRPGQVLARGGCACRHDTAIGSRHEPACLMAALPSMRTRSLHPLPSPRKEPPWLLQYIASPRTIPRR